MMSSRAIPRLVLVSDRKSARLPLPELARRAVAGGVDLVQIREKDLALSELRDLAVAVLSAVGESHRVAVNGAPAVALELGIGLHLPETHPPLLQSKSARPYPLSRAVHSAAAARESGTVDFVIAGHVFATGSKPGLPPLGLDGLAAIAAASPAPVLGIGGMTPDRVNDIVARGAYGVAVLSAINGSTDPEGSARAFKDALESAMTQSDETMQVTVNGKQTQMKTGTTLLDFLKARGYHERLVVIELNGEIVPKAHFASTALSPEDRVEIVHFVGGG